MSENDFREIQGNSFRGSRYANFAGGGIDPQGNVSTGVSENDANLSGSSTDNLQSNQSTSNQNDESIEVPSFGAKEVVGSALPFVGQQVGQTVGSTLANGGTFREGIGTGFSSLANKVSGGLIGSSSGAGSQATNQALSSLGGKLGPATSSQVAGTQAGQSATRASNFGGAAGAGFATAAATLLTGGDIKDAAKAGVATGIGTAIGQALIPIPGGGFIGGTIGSLFCFIAGTPILMEDSSHKNIEDIVLGDRVALGGEVQAIGKSYADELYKYKNTILSGGHAVFEGGTWLRVEDSSLSKPYEPESEIDRYIVYPMATENNLIVTPWYISADVLEIPDATDKTYNEVELIDLLNSMDNRNEELLRFEELFL